MNHLRKRPNRTSRRPRSLRRRGAAVVLIVFLLVIFLATVALSVDVAYMHLINIELQASTDAAATAAVEILGQTGDVSKARAAAKQVAASNLVGGQPLTITDDDVTFGRGLYMSDGSIRFAETSLYVNSARITGRRENGSPSGPTQLFFARIFNIDEWETRRVATAARWDRDICLVVDRSGSMNYDSKLPDLKEAVTIFLDTLENNGHYDRIGLVSYNQGVRVDQQLTSTLSMISAHMSSMTADGQTNIGGGIYIGYGVLTSVFARPYTEKTMILLTDGLHNVGFDPVTPTAMCVADGIVIHTITLGPDADQERMLMIAEMTGGNHYHAPDGDTLKEIYRKIASTFGTILTE